LPAIAFFSALLFVSQNKSAVPDALGFAFCLLILLLFFLTGFGFHHYNGYNNEFAQKEAASILAFKPNVLVVGKYAVTFVSYKIATESRQNGNYLDFGWVMPVDSEEAVHVYITDYNSRQFPISSNVMDTMPPIENPKYYRKNTSIKQFDYILVNGHDGIFSDGDLIYNKSQVQIYKIGG
jgi:hypothetical protein